MSYTMEIATRTKKRGYAKAKDRIASATTGSVTFKCGYSGANVNKNICRWVSKTSHKNIYSMNNQC